MQALRSSTVIFGMTLLTACGGGAGASAPASTGDSGATSGEDASGPKSSGGDPTASDKVSETARKLLRDAKDSPKTFVFNERKGEGPGLGHTRIAVDGRDVWPPQGDGCEALVSCCDQRVKNDDRFVLICQLAIGRDESCGAAQTTVNQVASELELPRIDACGG